MNFYTSDTHFWHTNVVIHDHAPFSSIEERDQTIIDNWNHLVTKKDSVYILGDFCWKNARKAEEIIRKLNGKKFLIRGNHDHCVKDSVCQSLFSDIYDYLVINDSGYKIVMSHYPMLFYQDQHRGAIHLYGHVHNSREEQLFQEACDRIADTTDIPFRTCNVGVSLWDYRPVSIKDILIKIGID